MWKINISNRHKMKKCFFQIVKSIYAMQNILSVVIFHFKLISKSRIKVWLQMAMQYNFTKTFNFLKRESHSNFPSPRKYFTKQKNSQSQMQKNYNLNIWNNFYIINLFHKTIVEVKKYFLSSIAFHARECCNDINKNDIHVMLHHEVK